MSDHITGSSRSASLIGALTLSGAALVSAASANADITVVNVGQDIGWGSFMSAPPPPIQSLTYNLPGSNFFKFLTTTGTSGGNPGRTIRLSNLNVPFAGKSGVILPAAAGQTWNDVGTAAGSEAGNGRFLGLVSTGSGTHSLGSVISPGPNQYLLYKFRDTSSQLDYGWLKVDYVVVNFKNFGLHIDSYAYDTSGTKIKAGDLGATTTPEPSGALSGAMLALVLGADGVRRMKRSKGNEFAS